MAQGIQSEMVLEGRRSSRQLSANEDMPLATLPCFPACICDASDASNASKLDNSTLEQFVPSSTVALRCKLRLFGAFWVFFLCGWGDGVTGTLLPYFSKDFNLSYIETSLLFIANSVGFTLGTGCISPVMKLLGQFPKIADAKHDNKGGPLHVRSAFSFASRLSMTGYSSLRARYITLLVFSMTHSCFFIIMGSRLGLRGLLSAYAISSFSRAFLTASVNAFVASRPSKPLGQLHACWGFGSFMAPLVCQSLIAKGTPWFHFYYGSLVLSAINLGVLALVFYPTRVELQEEQQSDVNESNPSSTISTPLDEKIQTVLDKDLIVPINHGASIAESNDSTYNCHASLRDILVIPIIWAFCIFAFIYSGSETTTQGYIVTYLLGVRQANPATVGYVNSGFWAGMSASRLTMGFISPKLSFAIRKHLIHVFLALALANHFLLWFIDSNVQNSISASLIGLTYGPIFPTMLGLATEILPVHTHLLTMAVISAFANFGSSIFPFLMGTLANIKGVQVLPYLTVAQASALILLWSLFPSQTRSIKNSGA